MASQVVQFKNESLNASIYIDYENIYELLKRYGADPLAINFFPVLLEKLRSEDHLNIVECIAYANLEKKPFQGKHLTLLHNLGVQTRHTASNGKNCGDMMLTVDALTTLYKVPHIRVFVIISSDRDMIPLINTIKRENRFAYMLSTKYGFNQAVSGYADCHEYIEDIFDLTPEMATAAEEETSEIMISNEEVNENDIENAKEVSRLLYSSHIWEIYEKEGNPITMHGYLKIIAPKIGAKNEQVVNYFKLAHYHKYITIYQDKNKGLCLKKGDNYLEVFERNDDIG